MLERDYSWITRPVNDRACVYQILFPDGTMYIGSTKTFNLRQNVWSYELGKEDNGLLASKYQELGSARIQVLYWMDKENVRAKEQEILDKVKESRSLLNTHTSVCPALTRLVPNKKHHRKGKRSSKEHINKIQRECSRVNVIRTALKVTQ